MSRPFDLCYNDGVEQRRTVGNEGLKKIAQIERNQLGWRQPGNMFLYERRLVWTVPFWL